jgi:uncharacterized repeat protein (TIGR03803 family)
LILSSNTLYGTAGSGGSLRRGTVFAVNVNGMGFTTLHTFTGGSDGVGPSAGLILSGNTLYGATPGGGSRPGNGTVFSVNTNGTGYTTLYSFTAGSTNSSGAYTNIDGASPQGGLTLSGNTLYGTAIGGGSSGGGTVFAINIDGTGFTNLHSFTAAFYPAYTNNGGAYPYAGLILSGNTLYGTASTGGSSGRGTVFAINTSGTDFATLFGFDGNIGGGPSAGLILSGNTLYGTAVNGGSSGNGTVFAVNTDGNGFTNLYSFTAYSGSSGVDGEGTNSDGAWPQAGLILAGSTLYGSAEFGGSLGNGTVFSINTNGTGFTNLHTFSIGSDGAYPQTSLILSGNTLYGAALGGGISGTGSGTVFSLTLPPPQLTIARSEVNFIFSWPTNATGFTLQSTTNLGSPVWTTNSPAPVVLNGQNTVTNPISGTQQFFRLRQR